MRMFPLVLIVRTGRRRLGSRFTAVGSQAKYIRTQTDKARAYLAEGKMAEFAKSLLEVSLKIVTLIIR
jgi:hypothetical protein